MNFLAASNANLHELVIIGGIIIILGIILRFLKQPYIVAYILAGIFLGENGFQIITDREVINTMGDIGLILLLFFIGMEISLPNLLKNWKVALFGTFMQVIGSVAFSAIIGWFFDWQMNRIIIMGFVLSLSSSAIIIKLLQDNGELKTSTGKNVLSILLMQDVLIVPMLITSSYLGGSPPGTSEIILQIIGGSLIIGAIFIIWKKQTLNVPMNERIEKDHELQVFIALVTCFGCAAITEFFGLSGALGAFVGGMIIHSTPSVKWIHDSLHSFRVIFVAVFFISIGILIDLNFITQNWELISIILLIIFLCNHGINALVLHYFGRNWKNSFYGGAMLSQVGELGFVLVASALSTQIISGFTYQLTIVVISLSLLISPMWIELTKKLGRIK